MKQAPLILGLFLTATRTFSVEPGFNAERNACRARVQVLANTSTDGRNTGGRGFSRPAANVASEFQWINIEPAGAKGLMQPTDFSFPQIVEGQVSLEPGRSVFIRSDQYGYVRQGILSIFFGSSLEPGSAEERWRKAWLSQRYHVPSGDPNQPVDKAAAVQFDRVLLALAERVADAPSRPQWKPDSFFEWFAK